MVHSALMEVGNELSLNIDISSVCPFFKERSYKFAIGVFRSTSMTWTFLGLFVAIYCIIPPALSISCGELKKEYENDCLETSDRNNYLQCVRTRMKRHQRDCEYDFECNECQCDICSYNQCGGQCDNCCHSCCSNYIRCQTSHCCHKQCNSECRSSTCRKSCRSACYNTVEQERRRPPEEPKIVQAPVITAEKSSTNNTSPRISNITTIITVKNVINSTNLVDIPINLTCHNQNNITLNENDQTDKLDGCCIVIGPRQCERTSTSPYVKCFHTRSRQCGSYCTAKIVHEENRQICTSTDSFGRPANCQQQTTYIPQPKPKCVYTSVWPYVSCGIQPPTECDGCYGQNFNQGKPCPAQCFESFGVGPLYRQGPYYQNGFSQVPPCMMSPQGCGGVGGYGGGYGPYPGFGGGGNVLDQSFGGGLFSGFGAGAPNSPSFIPFHVTPLLNGTEGEPTEKPLSYQAGLGPNNDMEIEVTVVDPDKSRESSYITRRDAGPKKTH